MPKMRLAHSRPWTSVPDFDPLESRMNETSVGGWSPLGSEWNAQSGPRESMRRLPKMFQRPLTWLTGMPLEGQTPRRSRRVWPFAIGPYLAMVAGATISTEGLSIGGFGFVLMPVGWFFTLHGARLCRQLILHQASHGRLFEIRWLDDLSGRLAAAVTIESEFDLYRDSHVRGHHGKRHMTAEDPTVKELYRMGLRAGMPVQDLWHRLLMTLVSPRYHVAVFARRLRAWLIEPRTLSGRIMVAAVLASWLVFGFLAGWTALLVSLLVPFSVLYQAARALRVVVEHDFRPSGETGRFHPAERSFAVFLGDAAPPRSLGHLARIVAWTRWTARLAFIHLPCRYLVLVADAVVHDFHHRVPNTRDWCNYVYARYADARHPRPGYPASRGVWTLKAGIEMVLQSISSADPADYTNLTGGN